jgi:threonyl-tRNA synthetase
MIKITLPDGSIREYAADVTPMEVAKSKRRFLET